MRTLSYQPIAVPTPGIRDVADIAQVVTPIAAIESDRPKLVTDAVAFAFLRFPSARRSREHDRLRCRGTLALARQVRADPFH